MRRPRPERAGGRRKPFARRRRLAAGPCATHTGRRLAREALFTRRRAPNALEAGGRGVSVTARRLLRRAPVTCTAPEAADGGPAAPPPARRRGRPPIHLSLSLNLVMPSQFFPEGGDGPAPGERRLMRAVLKDALAVLFKYEGSEDRRGRCLRAEAQQWVASDDASWPFSFVNVCGALGLDPSCVRTGLARSLAAQRTRSTNVVP